MKRPICNGLVPIKKRCFDDEMFQIHALIHVMPEFWIADGVARVDQATGRTLKVIAAGGDGMFRRNGRDSDRFIDRDGFIEPDGPIHHARCFGSRNNRKIRPNLVVEKMRSQASNGLGLGNHTLWPIANALNGIDQKRQVRHVIEVAMGQKYLINAAQRINRQIPDPSAGIDQRCAIEQKTAGAPALTDTPTASQDV